MAIINALKAELIRMKKYCVKLENHIHSVQDGELDPSAPLPVRKSITSAYSFAYCCNVESSSSWEQRRNKFSH